MKMVKYKPLGSLEIVEIPEESVPPNALLFQIQGTNDRVYMHAEDVQLPPPTMSSNLDLNGEQKRYALRAWERVKEIYPVSKQDWLDGFVRERNPNQEIALWDVYSRVYEYLSEGRPRTEKEDIWNIIVAYMAGANCENLLKNHKFQFISQEEVRLVLETCQHPGASLADKDVN